MNLNGKILPLQPLNFTSIPSVYEDNFTFLEELESLHKTVVEIIAFLEDFNMEKIDEKINIAIEELRVYTDNKNNELDNELRNYINSQIQIINNKLVNLQENLVFYTDSQISNLLDIINSIKTELEAEIESIVVGNISVLNPTTGTIDPLEKVLTDIYDIFRTDAISCSEFDSLEITATDFDSLQLTASMFDLYSKNLLIQV